MVTGGIHQDVSVVPGMMYRLQFAFGGNDSRQNNRGPLSVVWGTPTGVIPWTRQTVATIDVEAVSISPPNWRYLTFDVLATDPVMRVGFNTYLGQAYPLIDDVSLVAVPEPTALALFALATAGLLVALRRGR